MLHLVEAAASPFEVRVIIDPSSRTQSTEMRLAAAHSLAYFPAQSLARVQLDLVQDDDADVREATRRSIGSNQHLAIIARDIFGTLRQVLGSTQLVEQVVLNGCGAWTNLAVLTHAAEAIVTLRTPSAQLFAEEPPNVRCSLSATSNVRSSIATTSSR